MKDRTKMDIRLEIIEELYEGDGKVAERVRTERPDLAKELDSMQSMKSALDARPSHKPDAAIFDAVLKAAANASVGGHPDGLRPAARQDRPPRARRALYLRSAGVATAVLTVLLAVTTVWQTNVLDGNLPMVTERIAAEATEDERVPAADIQDSAPDKVVHGEAASLVGGPPADARPPADASPRADARPPAKARPAFDVRRAGDAAAEVRTISRGSADERQAINEVQIAKMESDRSALSLSVAGPEGRRRPSDILPIGMRPIDFAAQPGGTGELEGPGRISDKDLVWDQSADVMEMYQQIEMIGDGVARGWEPASVPLELIPASRQAGPSGIQPAGERRTP